MASSRGNRELAKKVLGDPDNYPAEFKTWVPRVVTENPSFKIETYNLPTVEQSHYVGVGSNPAFENSWVNYGAGYDDVGFYKDPFGMVHLFGLMKTGTIGLRAFVLPAGYRPKGSQIFPGASNGAFALTQVMSDGSVTPSIGSNVYYSLSGIVFRAF